MTNKMFWGSSLWGVEKHRRSSRLAPPNTPFHTATVSLGLARSFLFLRHIGRHIKIFVVFRNLLRNLLSIIYESSKIMHSRQQQLIKSQQDQNMHQSKQQQRHHTSMIPRYASYCARRAAAQYLMRSTTWSRKMLRITMGI